MPIVMAADLDTARGEGDDVAVTFPLPNDTDERARAVQIRLLRAATPQRRAEVALAMSQRCRWLAREALKRRHPELDDAALDWMLAEQLYGHALIARAREHARRREAAVER